MFLLLLLAATDLLAVHECARCHEGAGEKPPIEKQCVGCHQAILGGTFGAPPGVLAKWTKSLHSLNAAPDLANAARLRRAWVVEFLLAPHDLRPALPATMPRLALTRDEAEQIAKALVPGEAPEEAFDPGEVAAGRAHYDALGCGTCHAFVSPARASVPLAPDLAHVRARMQSGALVGYLLDPPPSMPTIAMCRETARAIAAYLVHEPLARPAPPKPIARLPVLKRRVTFDEVNARVLEKTCWHCHSSPEYAMGDGGPGNTGGLGFPRRGLDLATYEAVASGAIDDDGRRKSIFRPHGATGTPKLLVHLLARQAEERGAPISGIRGMPLGLPSLSSEDVQLVESWIAQGRPRE